MAFGRSSARGRSNGVEPWKFSSIPKSSSPREVGSSKLELPTRRQTAIMRQESFHLSPGEHQLSSDAWICPACTLRQPKAGLCMFCGAPSPEATNDDDSCGCAPFDTGETLNRDVLKQRRQFIASRIRTEFPTLDEEGFDVELIRNARKRVRQFVFGENASQALTSYERSVLLQHCLDELFGYGPLGPLVRDPEVQEIKVFSKDLTMVRKKGDEFEDASVKFDDDAHLHSLVDVIKGRSSPSSWRDLAQAYFDHYVTWDGIKISVSQIPVPNGTAYMTFLFKNRSVRNPIPLPSKNHKRRASPA